MVKRRLLVSAPFMEQAFGHVLNAEELKARFVAHEGVTSEGIRYRIIGDPIPDDAVISAPEKNSDLFVYEYGVISDRWDDDDPPVLLPRIERIRG